MKALLVDDSPLQDRAIEVLLERVVAPEPLEFRTCRDGAEGRDLILAEPWDVVLLDLRMPGLDGLEFLQEMRAANPPILTPVIVISGSVDPEDRRMAFRLGAEDFLQKPFEAERLETRVIAILERKRLHHETQLLALATDRTAAAVIITDGSGAVLWANSGFRHVTGYSLPEVIGQRPGRILQGPATDPATVQTMSEALKRQESFEVEIFNYRKSGHGYWGLLKVDPVIDEFGRLSRFVGVQWDITHRKQIQSELDEERRFLQSLIRNLPGMVYRGLVNESLTLTYVSAGSVALTGYAPDELEHDRVISSLDLVVPEDRARVSAELHQCLVNRAPFACEYRILRKDGTVRWAFERATGLYAPDGTPLGIEGFIQDIHDRKLAEESARAHSARIRAIYEAEFGCIQVLDEQRRITSINAAGLAILDAQTEAQVAGRDMREIILPEYWAIYDQAMTAGFRGQTSQIEFEIATHLGRQKWIEQQAVPIFDPHVPGRVIELLAVSRDVTERKRAELTLRESEQRWKSALEAADHGVWDWALPAKKLVISDLVKAMGGYSREELSDDEQEWLSRLHPDDYPVVMAALEAHFEGKTKFYDSEQRIRCKDGRWKWLHIRGLLVQRTPEGAPLRMIGTVTDISGRKTGEALERLRADAMTQLATDAPLEQILETIILGIRAESPGLMCGIWLVEPGGDFLVMKASVGLPEDFKTLACTVPVANSRSVCPCGQAAATCQLSEIEDLAHQPDLSEYDRAILATGIRALWSYPIFDRARNVIGTLCHCYATPHAHTDAERIRSHLAAQLVSLAVQQRTSQSALAASEARLRLAVETSGVGTWRRNLKSGETIWDERMQEIFGVPGPISFEAFCEMVLPEDRALVHGSWSKLKEGIDVPPIDFRICRTDGRLAHISGRYRVHRDDKGQPEWVTGVNADVTDLVESTRALHQSQQRLRLVFDAVAEGLVVQDRSGKIVESNATAARILGLTEDQLHGRTSLDPKWKTIHRDGSPFPGETHPSMVALRTGDPVHDVLMGVTRPDGEVVWIEINAVPLKEADGQASTVVCSFADVTERLAAQDEVMRSRRFRALGEIVGGVAHEFNNLLQPMLIQMNSVKRSSNTPPTVLEQLEPVEEAIAHAEDLCRRILAMGRKADETHERIALPKLIESALALMGAVLDSRIEVVVRHESEGPNVWLPRAQLHQVVMNLCLNARDTILEKLAGKHPPRWMPRLEITTGISSAVRPPRPELPPEESTEWACIAVSDNGMGIPASVMARIFEPFFTTKVGSQGTGLGLAVIWNLVDSFHGWIDVDSRPGEGTTFRVFLPIDRRSRASHVPRGSVTPTVAPHSASQRILLVEDNALVAKTFRNVLTGAGHRVQVVADGTNALDQILHQRAHFDLVISDLMLPKLNGLELAGLLQQLAFPGRFIVISGYVAKAQQDELMKKGVFRILLKPVSPDLLLETVNEAAQPPQTENSPPPK